jgi:hypothetical protein
MLVVCGKHLVKISQKICSSFSYVMKYPIFDAG